VSKKTFLGLIWVLWIASFAAANSLANDLIVYPSKNQSTQQQDKDN
jgi:hypothetical protein